MYSMARIFCTNCSQKLKPSDLKCPRCGSQNKFIDDAPLLPLDKITFRIVEKDNSGGSKCLYETTIKPDFDRDTYQDTTVVRKFNKRKECVALYGSYIEDIWARGGHLIKRNIGKLSEHKGHGSDRKNRRP